MSKKGLSSLLFVLGADIGEFQTEMRKATRDMEKWGKDMQKIGKNFSTYVTAPIVAFGAGSVMAFRGINEAMKQVDAGILSTGGAAGYTSDELRKMATELGHMSNTLNADILKDVTAQMLTFTNVTGDAFEKAQIAALDLSARMDTDLKSASIMVGKALNDPIQGLTALSRVGIQFTEDQKEMIRAMNDTGDVAGAQTVILKELERQFGGSAAAAGDAFTNMANTAKMMGQEFGEIIFDFLEPFILRVTDLMKKFSELDEGTKKIIVVVGGLAAAIGPLLISIGFMAKTVIPSLIAGFKVLNAVMFANPVGLITLGIAALVGYVAIAIKHWDQFGKAMMLVTGPIGIVVSMVQSFRKNWESVVSAFRDGGILQGLKRVGMVILDALIAPIQQVLELLSRIPGMNIAGRWAENINNFRENVLNIDTSPIKKTSDQAEEASDNIADFANNTNAAADATNNLNSGLAKEVGLLEGLNDQLKYWRDVETEAKTTEQIAESLRRQEEIKKEIEQLRTLAQTMNFVADLKGPQKIAPVSGDIKSGSQDDQGQFGFGVAGMDQLIESAGIVKRELSDAAREIVDSWNEFNYTLEATDQAMFMLRDHAGLMLNELGSAITGLGSDFKGVVDSMISGLQRIINGLLAQAIAGVIAGESKKGLIGLALGAVGVGALKAIWSANVPKLEHGAIVPPGYINDSYPALLKSGERITPPHKLDSNIGGGGKQEMVARFVNAGPDLLAYMNEWKRRLE